MNVEEIIKLLQSIAALPEGTQMGVGAVALTVVICGSYFVVELGKKLIDGIVVVVGKLVDGTVRIFQELGRAFGKHVPEYMVDRRGRILSSRKEGEAERTKK
ncbi:MAG: hypothetical protein MUP45_00960 [Candidatus Marinimicrobia bacterium]|nr:hypothetical protein [Candidatus Neomarinimicrobiota bacterium]